MAPKLSGGPKYPIYDVWFMISPQMRFSWPKKWEKLSFSNEKMVVWLQNFCGGLSSSKHTILNHFWLGQLKPPRLTQCNPNRYTIDDSNWLTTPYNKWLKTDEWQLKWNHLWLNTIDDWSSLTTQVDKWQFKSIDHRLKILNKNKLFVWTSFSWSKL